MEENIFCQNCGSANAAGSKFCIMCGSELKVIPTPIPAAEPEQPAESVQKPVVPEENSDIPEDIQNILDIPEDTPEEEPIPAAMFEEYSEPAPIPVPVAPQPAEKKQKKEKKEKKENKPAKAEPVSTVKPKRHIAAKIFAVLFSIILFAVGLIPTVLYPIHKMVEEDNIRDAVMSADIYEVVEDALDGKEVSDFIIDSVHAKMKDKLDPDEKQIKKLLEDEAVKEFVADKLVDYASDLCENNGDGEITGREVYRFVKANRTLISSAIGHELTDTELSALQTQLDKEGLEDYSLDGIREEYPDVFEYIEFALSDIAVYCACGIVVFFALIIFLICLKCVPFALKSVGIVFFINGGIALLVKPAYLIVAKIFDSEMGAFTSMIEAIGKPFFDGMLFVGFVFVCAGAALIFINIIVYLIKLIINKVKAKRA